MHSRRLVLLALAGAAVAVCPVFAAPAAAAVRYDPEAKTGFVGGGDVRKAFGWSAPVLAKRAGGLAFGQDFTTVDNYSVACGGAEFPVEHHRVFGRFELNHAIVRAGGRGAAAGYHGKPVNFRLTGAYAGISGTSVAPAPGQPCPRGEGMVSRATMVSTTTGWTLTVSSGDLRRELLKHETTTPS